MNLFPIVIRELRVAARRKKTYSARFWTAVAAGLVGAGILITLSFVPFIPGMGWAIFQGMAVACFLHCLGLASHTADCVSEEKREGTLGLLFLTDLSGWDVALGKLCANGLKSFYAVLGTFPVVAIVLVLGGVSAGQFGKMALALLNIFFFTHVAGLLASVWCRAADRAHAATILLLVVFLAGPPLLSIPVSHGYFYPLAPLISGLSPADAFAQAMNPAGGRHFWNSLLLGHLTGWGLLTLASRRLPFCWQDKAGPTRLRWRERFRQWTYGPPEFRRNLRRRLAGVNPFWWLVSRNRLTPIIVWVTLLLLAALWVVGGFIMGRGDCLVYFSLGILVNNMLLVCGVISEASRHLEEQRLSGALEFALCATPLPPSEFIAGQWLALRRLFLRPFIFVVVTDLALALLGLCLSDSREKADSAFFILVAMVLFLVEMPAAAWVGMWRAMAMRKTKSNAAIGETISLLFFLPCAFQGILIMPLAWVYRDRPTPFVLTGPFLVALWIVLTCGLAAGFSWHGREQLLTRFRQLAVVQSGEPLGTLALLGRWFGRVVRRVSR
jgi:ABC-type transport system involved in multi-copper enzyme maturation permease subunit